MEGLSIRSVFVSLFFHAVIFLFLLDNETSLIILVSKGIGMLIEGWKITRVTSFKVGQGFLFSFIASPQALSLLRSRRSFPSFECPP